MASAEVARLIAKLEADVSDFQRDMKRATAGMTRFEKSTGRLGKAMESLNRKAKRLVQVGIGLIVGAVAASVKAFADFDDKMNQSLAIMGNVSDTMRKDMTAAAREVGKTTRLSAADAAESYFFLASAGLDAAQSIAALPQVAAFAQAGMFDMATATDLATDAQSALGLTVDDAQKNLMNLTKVTDVLVKANTLANATVEQFSRSLTNKAGAALRLLGKDMEEGVAVLAAFADQGVKGEEAGQRLNIVLRDLQTASINNRDTFEDMNIAVFDSEGEFRHLADVLKDMENALGGMSDEGTRTSLMLLGFQDRSVSAIMSLLGLSDAIREYDKELRTAAGSTEEVAERQLESLKGQLDLLKGEIVDIGISIGGALSEALLDAIPTIKDWANTFGVAIIEILDFAGAIDHAKAQALIFELQTGGTADAVEGFLTRIVTGLSGKDGMVNWWDRAVNMIFGYRKGMKQLIRDTDAAPNVIRGVVDELDNMVEAGRITASQAIIVGIMLEEELARKMDIAAEKSAELSGGSEELAEKLLRTGVAAASAASGLSPLDEAISAAGASAEAARIQVLGLLDLLRAQTDPAFAFRQAGIAVEEATKAFEKERKKGATSPAAIKAWETLVNAQFDFVEARQKVKDLGPRFQEEIFNLAEINDATETAVAFIEDVLEFDQESIELELAFKGVSLLEWVAHILGLISTPVAPPVPGRGPRGPGGAIGLAHGGPAMAGRPYVVGEQGPELFVPNQSGTVVPNGGFGGNVNVDVTLEVTESVADAELLARDTVRAIRDELERIGSEVA
jgi:TP901 family phage tail tape measure protein